MNQKRIELLKCKIVDKIEAHGYFQKLNVWSDLYNIYVEYENVYDREHKIKYECRLETLLLDADYNPREIFRDRNVEAFCRQIVVDGDRNKYAIVTKTFDKQ